MGRSNWSMRLFGNHQSRNKRGPIWLVVPVLFLVLLSILPILYIAFRAREAGWDEAVRLIFRPRVFELLTNTVKLNIAVTLLGVLIGVTTAWCIERTNLPGKKLWNSLVTLPFAVPAFVSSYSWISIYPGFAGFDGAVLILTLSNYPLVHLPVAAALRGMDPALEETSRSLGYGRFATFFRVVLPQLRPSLLGGGILISLHMLAEFGTLAFLNFDTFTTAIFDQYNVAFDGASAAMLTFVLLVLCLFVLGLEMVIRGTSTYTGPRKGAKGKLETIKLGWKMPFVMSGFSILVILAVCIPLGTITYWLITGSSANFIFSEVSSSLLTTLSLGLSGSVITIIFALPLVILAIRYRGPLSILADRLPYFIHSLPGLVIGLTLIFFAVRFAFPFYQTTPLLLIGYAMLYLPLAQSSVRSAMEQVPIQLEETARSLGKRPLSVFFTITLPLIAPGVGAGLALVFLQVMQELTATLLLRPTGVSTLATKIWEHTSAAEYAASAPYAALLILFAGLPVYLLTMRSFTHRKEVS